MKDLIIDLIADYQSTVEKVMSAFKQKFNRIDLLTACRSDRIISRIGELKEYGIEQYKFHGIGLDVTFTDKTTVDFDFAFLPEQRCDGFNLWRLREFISNRPGKYQKYVDEEILKKDFTELIRKEIIINPNTSPSTSLYFFKEALH